MKTNWVKTNWLVKKIFSKYIWEIPNNEKKVYLTFDDGPIPEITEWVLGQLESYNFKATFFCVGENIKKNPEIFKKILTNGHVVGNHTYNHIKGWNFDTKTYIENIYLFEQEWAKHTSERCYLFRPPYGKIKPSQSKILRKLGYKIIMWDILSYDFEQTLSPEACLDNVIKNITSGSIVVFHDSKKSFTNLEFALPKTLDFLKKNGYQSALIH
ncbi:polysaccharide deacetylase family protein [Flavobacterium aciduliphilum]|nr:polysaccharide deacetylase family protein [Flavobacterium aciduliphilum]